MQSSCAHAVAVVSTASVLRLRCMSMCVHGVFLVCYLYWWWFVCVCVCVGGGGGGGEP
jgi:hypothetical protein